MKLKEYVNPKPSPGDIGVVPARSYDDAVMLKKEMDLKEIYVSTSIWLDEGKYSVHWIKLKTVVNK